MIRILIADDEESIRILYADELTQEGYEVITRCDGSQILDLIKKTRPDVVVLDIKMGGHDGLDILQDIRNAHYDLPVILCSTYSFYKYDKKSIAADYYVVKGSDLGDLKSKVKMAIVGVDGMQLQLGEVPNGTHLPERIVLEADIIPL